MKRLVKTGIALMVILSLTTPLKAQTTKEWLSQKKTQKEYLLKQIAALEIYKRSVKKGYKIAQKGLNTIGNIKDGDFKLHKDYFNSLLQVNPNIKKYGRVADVMAMQRSVLLTYTKDYSAIKSNKGLLPREVVYTAKVYDRVIDNCNDLISDLILLVSDGNYTMSDDERLQQIDALYLEMQEILGFTQKFGKEAIALGISRENEKANIQQSKILTNIKTSIK